MRISRTFLTTAAGVALGVTLVTAVALPTIAAAAPTPLFTQCPAAGPDTGCGVLITVNPDGSTTVATDPGQPALSPSAVLVGIVT